MACMALLLIPMLIGGRWLSGKYDPKKPKKESEKKKDNQADIMASDCIQHYKTVSAMASEDTIVQSYSDNLEGAVKEHRSLSILTGFFYGMSQFMTSFTFGGLFFISNWLMRPDVACLDPMNAQRSMWSILFGAFSAVQAAQFGPDLAAGMAAAEKIFKMINTPSKIDALADDDKKVSAKTDENFRGEIEFKNVWFRYPSRLDDWVFKGLNLKIEKDMCIAIVGESGSGKSTFINLVMRFYDPEIGQVLIDGVDAKEYSVADLRSKMGLVMQEPTLFNYSVKDNILYGQHKASNQDIHNAAQIANALEFVESADLKNAFEDNAVALHEEFVKRDSAMKQVLGANYEEFKKDLTKLKDQEQKEGTRFEVEHNAIDKRTEEQTGSYKMHDGFNVNTGMRGSKLSGGQKQRLAIARAVIRNPRILLLDEATSALDEASQKKV